MPRKGNKNFSNKVLTSQVQSINNNTKIGLYDKEVFRITPSIGKCYEYANYTKKIGKYPTERFFSSYDPVYIGKYKGMIRWGGGEPYTKFFFNDNGEQKTLFASDTLSFVEVPCQTIQGGKRKTRKQSKKRRQTRRK